MDCGESRYSIKQTSVEDYRHLSSNIYHTSAANRASASPTTVSETSDLVPFESQEQMSDFK